MKANYNKSEIMKRAWKLFKNQDVKTSEMFGNCLRQSWQIAKNGLKDNNITAIYKKYYNEVYYHILTKVGSKSEIAEELTNDVFIKAEKHLYKYDVHRAKLNTWLITIAKNIVIDYYRTYNDKNASQLNVSDFTDETGRELYQFAETTTTDYMENNELSEAIDRAMSNLKPRYRAVAELYLVDQKLYVEIAEILDMPLGSVKGMISRAKKMLQTELQSCSLA